MGHLAATVQNDRSLRAELLRQFPELEDDERTLIDTLDGISDLDEQIIAAMRLAVEREAMAEGIKGLVSKLGDRKSRLEYGAEKIRTAVLNAMLEAGRKTINAPDMTLTASTGRPGVQIVDEALLPETLMKVVRSPDMKAINEAVKAGEVVPGTAPKNPRPYLTIRLA